MWKDPIVEEVRQQREAHAKKFDYDLRAIYQDLKRQEEESERTFIKLPAKRIRTENQAA